MTKAPSPVGAPRWRTLRPCTEVTEVEELRTRLHAAHSALAILLQGYHGMNVNWLASFPAWLEEHIVPGLQSAGDPRGTTVLALANQLRTATHRAQLALELSWAYLRQFHGRDDTSQLDRCLRIQVHRT